jgi:hypothetical protein
LRLVLLFLLLTTFWVLPSAFCAEEDPVPIRRILISLEQVPAQLANVRKGVLKKLSAAEFESRVKKAAGATFKNPPRLLKATYKATLSGTSLEDGIGNWFISNPSERPGILRLPDFNLALKPKVQFLEGAVDAILGDLDGEGLGLLVQNPGKNSLTFNWTARGDLGPDGLRFKLKVPPCPVASLDLTVPNDRIVSLFPRNRGVLTRVDQDNRVSHWLIHLSGQSEIDLVIHQTTGTSPLVLSRQETKQTLFPDRVEAQFKFQVEVLHNIARKLYFEYDPPLQPFEVSIQNLALQCERYESLRRGVPHLLVVELREPILNPEQPLPPLLIRCLAPLTLNQPWTSPGMRLVKVLPWGASSPNEKEPWAPYGVVAGSIIGRPDSGTILSDNRLVDALPRGETLTLQIHPEVQLRRWLNGSFRLTRTEVSPNRFQVLTLLGRDAIPLPADVLTTGCGLLAEPRGLGPLLAAAALPAGWHQVRPGAQLEAQHSDCLAQTFAWWQVAPRSMALTAQTTFKVIRGELFQLRLGIPLGWTVEQVRLVDPASKLSIPHRWTSEAGERPMGRAARSLLIIEPQRPVRSRHQIRLTIQLRKALNQPVPTSGRLLDFPDLEPLDARSRAGGLAITIDPLYKAAVFNPSVPASDPDRSKQVRMPWTGHIPDFYYSYRIQNNSGENPIVPRQAVTGKLLVRPYPPRLRADCATEVVLAPDHASMVLRLQLKPRVGNPQTIDLDVSCPLPGLWHWQTKRGSNQVVQMTPALFPPLLCLGSRTPLETIPFFILPGRAQHWRLLLARPLEGPLTLEASVPLVKEIHEVPLLTVPGADILNGEVTLYLAGTDGAELTTWGLREIALPARAAGGSAEPWRRFRYNRLKSPIWGAAASPTLTISRRNQARGRAAGEKIDHAQLTTYLQPGGKLVHHFVFRVWHWRDRTLTVRLPPGVELHAARAYGRWLPQPRHARTRDANVVEFPVASGNAMSIFEIVYNSERTGPPWAPWSRLEAPVPSLTV